MCIRDDAVAFDTFGIFSPPQQWAPSYAPRAPRDSCSTAFCGSCDPRGSAKSAWGGDLEGFATRRGWADDGTDMTREVIMAVPTPSRSLQRDLSASSSSRIDPAIGHLAALGQSLVDEGSDVLSVLGQVADPRKRRGVRHTLPVILGVVVCAVLAGARSFVAIAEWAADADDATLADLGAGAVVPCESTIRRTLQTLDADALDDAFGGWAQARTKPSPAV